MSLRGARAALGARSRLLTVAVGLSVAGLLFALFEAVLWATGRQYIDGPWFPGLTALAWIGYGWWAPSRVAASAFLVAFVVAFTVTPYLDGDDACNREPGCEDNLGILLGLVFGGLLIVMPGLIGMGGAAAADWYRAGKPKPPNGPA